MFLKTVVALSVLAQNPITPPGSWIWISPAQISALPMTGPEWDDVLDDADDFVDDNLIQIFNPEDRGDSRAMAAALVWRRTGNTEYRDKVIDGVMACIGTEDDTWDDGDPTTLDNTSLELSRNVTAVVIAAELVGLKTNSTFVDWVDSVRHFVREDGRSIVSTHEDRPQNWGTHAGAARIACARFVNDFTDLVAARDVFRGYLGDRTSYAGFDFHDDLSWHPNPSLPVPINPLGAVSPTNPSHSFDGVCPDDQRRCGSYPASWGCKTNYVYEQLQGLIAQAIMLKRAGFSSWTLSDNAILRCVQWLHTVNNQPFNDPENGSDDRWEAWVINDAYGTSYPLTTPAPHGKAVSGVPWTCLHVSWP